MHARYALATALLLLALPACQKAHAPAQAQAVSQPAAAQYAFVTVPAPPAETTAPKILEIALTAQRFTAPGQIDLRIKTSEDVTAVTARLLGREKAVPMVSAGLFGTVAQLPDVPFFLKNRDYQVEFVASTDDGRKTSASVLVHLNR